MKLYIEDNETLPAVLLLLEGESSPSGYTDKSQDLMCWKKYALPYCTDYLQFKMYVAEQSATKGWENMSADEKMFLCTDYIRPDGIDKATDESNKVTFLMGTGLSFAASVLILEDAFATWHIEEIISCRQRAESKKIFSIMAKYLTTIDASDFTNIIANPYFRFITQAIRGINDSDTGEGFFDIIESTEGTSFEYAGLEAQNYNLKTGNLSQFISDLMDVLRKGNY